MALTYDNIKAGIPRGQETPIMFHMYFKRGQRLTVFGHLGKKS